MQFIKPFKTHQKVRYLGRILDVLLIDTFLPLDNSDHLPPVNFIISDDNPNGSELFDFFYLFLLEDCSLFMQECSFKW